MPAVSRELSVVYGTITVGGTSDAYLLDGPVVVDEGPDEARVAFRFVMRAATEADFDTQVAALETNFRTPRQNTTVTQGAATLYSFSHSGNTGFDAEPVLRKLGDEFADSGRSRLYEASIQIGVPADVYAQSGRRHARVIFDYTPGRRRNITFAGEWVVQAGGSAARASYLSGVSAYCNSVLTAVTGTWEIIDENHNENETNKVLTWSRTYAEIIYNQSSAGLDHASIVNPTMTIVLGRRWPELPTGASVAHPGETTISYSTWIDKDVSTALATLWTGTIRPFLLSTAATLAGVTTAQQAVVEESPSFDTYENRISASMTLFVYHDIGRRNTVASIAFSPSRRRTLTLSGEWIDQNGGATARTSYDTGIDAYAATFTSALTGTWELVDETLDQDETDQIIRWRRVYREAVADQSDAGLDDVDLVDPTTLITVGVRAPGDSPNPPAGGLGAPEGGGGVAQDTVVEGPVGGGVERLLEVSVAFTAGVDHTLVKNLNLRDKWTNTIRPYLIKLAGDFAGGGQVAVLSEDPAYDWHENRINAAMSMVVRGKSDIIEYVRTEEISNDDHGVVFVDVWDGGDGFGCYEFQGPRRRRKTITESLKRIRGVGAPLRPARPPGLGVGNIGARWVPISDRLSSTPRFIGKTPDGFSVEEQFYQQVFRWSRSVGGALGGVSAPPV